MKKPDPVIALVAEHRRTARAVTIAMNSGDDRAYRIAQRVFFAASDKLASTAPASTDGAAASLARFISWCGDELTPHRRRWLRSILAGIRAGK